MPTDFSGNEPEDIYLLSPRDLDVKGYRHYKQEANVHVHCQLGPPVQLYAMKGDISVEDGASIMGTTDKQPMAVVTEDGQIVGTLVTRNGSITIESTATPKRGEEPNPPEVSRALLVVNGEGRVVVGKGAHVTETSIHINQGLEAADTSRLEALDVHGALQADIIKISKGAMTTHAGSTFSAYMVQGGGEILIKDGTQLVAPDVDQSYFDQIRANIRSQKGPDVIVDFQERSKEPPPAPAPVTELPPDTPLATTTALALIPKPENRVVIQYDKPVMQLVAETLYERFGETLASTVTIEPGVDVSKVPMKVTAATFNAEGVDLVNVDADVRLGMTARSMTGGSVKGTSLYKELEGVALGDAARAELEKRYEGQAKQNTLNLQEATNVKVEVEYGDINIDVVRGGSVEAQKGELNAIVLQDKAKVSADMVTARDVLSGSQVVANKVDITGRVENADIMASEVEVRHVGDGADITAKSLRVNGEVHRGARITAESIDFLKLPSVATLQAVVQNLSQTEVTVGGKAVDGRNSGYGGPGGS